jgi:uncharacterized protein (TIGR00251 family)
MKISVKVKTSAREERVEKTGENEYRVMVKAKPIEGKANDAIIRALAEHFGVPRSKISLMLGQKSKQKVFEVKA